MSQFQISLPAAFLSYAHTMCCKHVKKFTLLGLPSLQDWVSLFSLLTKCVEVCMSVLEDSQAPMLKANLWRLMRGLNISLNIPLGTLKTEMWSHLIMIDFSQPVKRKHVTSLMSCSELQQKGLKCFLALSALLQQQQKHWKCQMWGPKQQTRGSLKGSHQYRKGKKHLSSSGEPSQWWSPLFGRDSWEQLQLQ